MKTYIVYCPELGHPLEDGVEFKSHLDWSAAVAFAEYKDAEKNYSLASCRGDEEWIVFVLDKESKQIRQFSVSGYLDPRYNCHEITKQSEPQS